MPTCRTVAAKGAARILAVFCLAGDISAGAAQQVIEGPARVIDGDTLEVDFLLALHCDERMAP